MNMIFNEKKILLYIPLLFFLNCNKEISVSDPLKPANKSVILIESNPTNAKIYVEGKNTGKVTPDSVRWLKPGSYKILLRLKGWRDSSFNVDVSDKSKLSFNIDFTENPLMYGSIYCESYPTNAVIFLNDSATGKTTPAQLDYLLPGKYELKFIRNSCRDDSLEVYVQSQQVTKVDRNLPDTSRWVVYNKHYSNIPSNTVLCAAIDKFGYKWIGTDGGGLAMFDDRNWTVYNTSNSPLPDNRIQVIYIDENNVKWIGTTNYGLVRFDDVTWTNFEKSNSGIPGDMITTITSDKQGKIWVGTYKDGLAVLEGTNWTTYNEENSGLPSNWIRSIAVDKDDKKWIATWFGGLALYNSNNWMIYDTSKVKGISMMANALFIDNSNKLYLGCFGSDTIAVYDSKIWTYYKSFANQINWITEDEYQKIWVASNDNGFSLIESMFIFRDVFTMFNAPLGSNTINAVVVDKKNYKWICTLGNGLVKYKGKRL